MKPLIPSPITISDEELIKALQQILCELDYLHKMLQVQESHQPLH